MKNNKGFTFIELIITLAILGIVLFMSVIMLNSDSAYLKKMAKEFVLDVRYVQLENMKTPGTQCKIYIYPCYNEYKIKKFVNVEKTVKFKDNCSILFSNSTNVIAFSGEGIPTGAGTFTIINNKTSEMKQVTIVPGTGRTKVLE